MRNKFAQDFGFALVMLRAGKSVSRYGWNAKHRLVLVPGSTITVSAGRPLGDALPELVGKEVEYNDHIDIVTSIGTVAPWVASQVDLLASDWYLVDGADQ